MDGTILDTIGDLADSLDHALAVTGHRSDFSEEDTRIFFGSGVAVAVRRALAAEAGVPVERVLRIGTDITASDAGVDEDEAENVRKAFEAWYPSHCDIRTKPFDGMTEAIRALKRKGVSSAVVSNKMDEAVQELAEKYFPGVFEYSAGVREGVRRKPAPDVTLRAMELMETSPEQTVYIGDSEVDVETAENAGLDCIIVDWGFRSRGFLEKTGAGTICSTVEEMTAAILGGCR